jgi:hypothetical protein
MDIQVDEARVAAELETLAGFSDAPPRKPINGQELGSKISVGRRDY